MYTLFIEYAIASGKWEQFAAQIPHIRERVNRIGTVKSHLFLASEDQPGLVVEMIRADRETLEEIRRVRTSNSENLNQNPWVVGGKEKIRAWVFRELP